LHGLQPAEEGQLPGKQNGGADSEQHGDAAEVGHLDRMHIAIADSCHGAAAQRQLPAQSAGEKGNGRGNAQHQEVFAHLSLVSPVVTLSSWWLGSAVLSRIGI
jgi:hypothetical protein